MLYNRTRTYSLFQLNRDSRHPRVIRRSFFDFRHFWFRDPPRIRRFTNRHSQNSWNRKSERARHLTNELALHVNNASTHGTRRRPRRCVHPFDARMTFFLTATDARRRHPGARCRVSRRIMSRNCARERSAADPGDNRCAHSRPTRAFPTGFATRRRRRSM